MKKLFGFLGPLISKFFERKNFNISTPADFNDKIIGREGGSTRTNIVGEICHSKNKPKIGGQKTAFSPSDGAENLTVKTRRTDEATVKISAH